MALAGLLPGGCPGAGGQTSAAGTAKGLHKVMEVRHLSAEQAAQSLPLQLTGVVTALSGYRNSFFMEDGTAGISVDRTDHASVHVGDRVLVTGVSGPGAFAPVVLASYVRVLGRAAQPAARRVAYEDLIDGAEDSQRIEIHGVIHSAHMSKLFDKDVLQMKLSLGGLSINVLFQDFAGFDFARLIDSSVSVRGIASTGFNEKRQLVGVSLFVPSRRDVTILHAQSDDPLQGAAVPIRKALQFGQSLHRIKIAGVVTYQVPGEMLYVQDQSDGMRISSDSTEIVPIGSKVEVVGFPSMGDYAPVLNEAVFNVTGEFEEPKPQHVDPGKVIEAKDGFRTGHYADQLVQLEGKVIDSHLQGEELTWILREENQVFEVHLPRSLNDKGVAELPIGSRVSVVGICAITADSARSPISFHLIVRRAEDVLVLQRASWLTGARTLMIATILLGGMVLTLLWVVVLRNRVERQTRIIRESETRFRDLAEHDVLTGLPNRLMLEERIATCLERCRVEGLLAAVFTIDIDRFKQINDTYGHLAGDECLKIVAARLRTVVRTADTIARTGGEEFTLVAGCLKTRDRAESVAKAILDLFHVPMHLGGEEILVTVSVGGALFPVDATSSEALRRQSDEALYEAKRLGRDRAIFASAELCASLERAATIETALRDAMRISAFALVYEPIYDAAGSIRRLAAQITTTEPRLAELGTGSYLPAAEASGLILPLGRWVLEEACRQMAAWRAGGSGACPVTISVSARQLLHREFAHEVLGTLARYGIDPHLLELELTETAAARELPAAADKVTHLAEAGVLFSIADFGTGYSSLACLYDLPIAALKIHPRFVRDLEGSDGRADTIILAAVQMARTLKIQVQAEGVETARQFALLHKLGCDLFQGKLFARPLGPAEVDAALRDASIRPPQRQGAEMALTGTC